MIIQNLVLCVYLHWDAGLSPHASFPDRTGMVTGGSCRYMATNHLYSRFYQIEQQTALLNGMKTRTCYRSCIILNIIYLAYLSIYQNPVPMKIVHQLNIYSSTEIKIKLKCFYRICWIQIFRISKVIQIRLRVDLNIKPN